MLNANLIRNDSSSPHLELRVTETDFVGFKTRPFPGGQSGRGTRHASHRGIVGENQQQAPRQKSLLRNQEETLMLVVGIQLKAQNLLLK